MEEDDDLDLDREGEDVPWLREMVDEDLQGLFSEASEEVSRTTRDLALRSADDGTIAERLVEALRTSLERGNDDTQASVYMALLLGEIGETSSLGVLFQGLYSDDESLQEASGDAILKIGPPAIDALLDELEEDPGPELARAAYRLLGWVGNLHDPGLLKRATDFLAERVEREAALPEASRIEGLFQAAALLGDRRMLEPMDRVLRERFGGKNVSIRDSREMLAENVEGTPLLHQKLPWVEAHRWLFQDDPSSAQVKRRRGNQAEGGEEDPEEKRLASFYWGLSATVDREGKDPLDARKYIEKPEDEED